MKQIGRMQEVAKRLDRVLKDHVYYYVWFDGNLTNGRKASEEVQNKYESDKMFSLSEFDKCMEYINSLKKDHCDYSFRIEDWNEETEEIEHFVFRYFKHS